MKALVFTAVGSLDYLDVDTPSAKEDDALIRVSHAGVCGVDMSGFTGRNPLLAPLRILGHELVGRLERRPNSNQGAQAGDRVVVDPLMPCNICDECGSGRSNLCENLRLLGTNADPGAFAEWITVPASYVYRIAPHVTDTMATLIEPLAASVHLFTRIEHHPSARLIIYGAGVQGIFSLILAKLNGYERIAVVDPIPARLAIASRLGASMVLDPRVGKPTLALRDWSDRRGADVAIEATRSSEARGDVLSSLRPGGQAVFLGLSDNLSNIDFGAVVRKELQVRGSFAYTSEDFATAKKLVEAGRVDIDPWVQVRPLADGQEVFETMGKEPGKVLKYVLQIQPADPE